MSAAYTAGEAELYFFANQPQGHQPWERQKHLEKQQIHIFRSHPEHLHGLKWKIKTLLTNQMPQLAMVFKPLQNLSVLFASRGMSIKPI